MEFMGPPSTSFSRASTEQSIPSPAEAVTRQLSTGYRDRAITLCGVSQYDGLVIYALNSGSLAIGHHWGEKLINLGRVKDA